MRFTKLDSSVFWNKFFVKSLFVIFMKLVLKILSPKVQFISIGFNIGYGFDSLYYPPLKPWQGVKFYIYIRRGWVVTFSILFLLCVDLRVWRLKYDWSILSMASRTTVEGKFHLQCSKHQVIKFKVNYFQMIKHFYKFILILSLTLIPRARN